jgi:hypothetical protein
VRDARAFLPRPFFCGTVGPVLTCPRARLLVAVGIERPRDDGHWLVVHVCVSLLAKGVLKEGMKERGPHLQGGRPFVALVRRGEPETGPTPARAR